MAQISMGGTVRKPRQLQSPMVPPCDPVLMDRVLQYMKDRYIERGYWRSGEDDNKSVAEALGADANDVRSCFYNLSFRGLGGGGLFDFTLGVRVRRELFRQHNLLDSWSAKCRTGFSSELNDLGVKAEEVMRVY